MLDLRIFTRRSPNQVAGETEFCFSRGSVPDSEQNSFPGVATTSRVYLLFDPTHERGRLLSALQRRSAREC